MSTTIQIKHLEKIANQLNFLGCSVRLANDIEPNSYIEDDEQFFSRVIIPNSNYDNEEGVVTTSPVSSASYCYAQRVCESTLNLEGLTELYSMPVAQADISYSATARNYSNYMENSRLVLFGVQNTNTDDETGSHLQFDC